MRHDLTEFGNWLRREIDDRGWRITAFATHVGVQRNTVYAWFRGESQPTEWNCQRIAEALEVELDIVRVMAQWPPIKRRRTPSPAPEMNRQAVMEGRIGYDDLSDDELEDHIIGLTRHLAEATEVFERRKRGPRY